MTCFVRKTSTRHESLSLEERRRKKWGPDGRLINAILSRAEYDAMTVECKRQHRSKSSVIREMIQRWLDEQEDND